MHQSDLVDGTINENDKLNLKLKMAQKELELLSQSYIKLKHMNISDQIKNLIRNGKKDGCILRSGLDKKMPQLLNGRSNYIKNTIEGFKFKSLMLKVIMMN